MTEQQLRDVVRQALHRIAPEVDMDSIRGDADLREEIDLDSMDILSFLVSLHETLKVNIPESDYGRLATIDGCVQYLRERVR
jgi:acyl carrier protein